MRRFPDLSGLVTRGLLAASLACIGAGVMWLARASGDALFASSQQTRPPAADHEAVVDTRAATRPDDETRARAKQLAAIGQEIWEKYVPAEVRASYELPSVDEVRRFLTRLETELDDSSSEELAAYEREARRALRVLRRREGGDLLAAWLEPQLDLLKAASQIASTPVAHWPEIMPEAAPGDVDAVVAPAPMLPAPGVMRPQFTRTYWDRVLLARRAPRRAADYVPRLKEIFAAAGVPPELVWIAEVESSMNPEATSPVGARGLFQFMPLTAARFGLETGVMVDERTDPEKSARAAAAYLRVLHRRFRSWPLAIAAYNAGEGRVGRLLAREGAASFDAVAHRLPVETRMYVPKVLATVAARESVDPDALPAPWSVEADMPQIAGSDAAGAPDEVPAQAGAAVGEPIEAAASGEPAAATPSL